MQPIRMSSVPDSAGEQDADDGGRIAVDVAGERTTRVAEITVAALVLLLPFTLPIYVVLDRAARPDQNSLVFYPLDLGLTAVIGLGLPLAAGSLRRRSISRPVLLLLLFTCLTALSAAIHPGPAGMQFTLRLAAVTLLMHLLIELRLRVLSGPVLYACIIIGMEQALVAAAQSATGGPLGMLFLGIGDSTSVPMWTIGELVRPRGTLWYPYMLSGLAVLLTTVLLARVLSQQPRRWYVVATAFAAVPIGLTYSRTAVLSLTAIVMITLTCRRSWASRAAGAGAVLVGAATPALLTRDGWIARGEQTAASTSADVLASGRITGVREAWHLIERSPVFGVGPGNYLEALADAQIASPDLFYPVHNVPLLAAAESGIVSGLVLSCFLIALGARAWRGGAATLAIYVGLMPFLMLDVIPYRTPQGIVMFGLWAGAILTATRQRATGEERRPETAGAVEPPAAKTPG